MTDHDATIKAIHARAVANLYAARNTRARVRLTTPIDYESRERAVRAAMTGRGETQSELSERLNMPRAYIKHILNKHCKLGLAKQWRDGARWIYGVAA